MCKTERLTNMMAECENIVFFGGAGVSTESGVKDYRSEDGLFRTVKDYGVSPQTILSRSFFLANPAVFYDFYKKYFIAEVAPNDAHIALAELERRGKLKAIITQNIDGLHQKAGSKNVIELHGNNREFFCDACAEAADYAKTMEKIEEGEVPTCSHCGGVVRPRVVMYEEMLHPHVPELSAHYIENADMLIVGGTSLLVNPAATLLKYFRGKYFVILNKTDTDFDEAAHLVIRDSIGSVLKQAVQALK